MSDITRLAYLYQGLPRDIDATANSLQINSLKVGSSTPVELTKAMAQLMADVYTGSAGGKGLPAAHLATSAVTGLKIADSALGTSLLKTITYGEAVFTSQAVVDQGLYENIQAADKLKFGQSFTTGSSGNLISKITLPFTAYAPSGNVGIPLTCEIWTTSAGLPVAKVAGSATSGVVTVYPNDAFGYKDFTFSTPVALAPSTMYAFVIGNGPATGYLRTYYKSGDLFANGTMLVSNDTGTVWSKPGIPGGTSDLAFTIYESVATGATLDVNSLAITEARLAASAVTNAKIADNTIANAKLADNTITDAKIAANAITTAKIAYNAVTSAQIADSAVTAVKLNIGTGATAANRAVLESKLAAQRVGVLNFTPAQASSDTVTTQVLAAASVDTAIGAGAGIGAAAVRGIFVGTVSGATDIGKVLIRVNGTDNGIDDGTGDEIYGVLSESAGVYTLSYKKAGGTAYTLSADDVSRKLDFYFVEVMDLWTFGVDRFLLPAIGGVVDATTSNSLNTKILTETSNLQASLAAEATARSAADGILSADILAEASARSAADGIIDAALLAEASSRSSADGILSASITAEASARTLADIVLQGELDTTQGSMGNVIDGDGAWLGFGATKPAGTTNYLNSALTVTVALKTLDTGDFVLQTSITAEASARNTADLAIQAQLSNISSDKTFLNLTSSGAVAIGDVLALSKDTAGRVIKANATGILTCTHIVGVATEAATGAGELIKIQVTGEIVVNQDAAFTLGERVYVHTVSGQASKTAPGTIDNVVYLLGGATATDKLYLAPHLEFVVS